MNKSLEERMSYEYQNPWDRAVSAEYRRCKRLGFNWQQPTRSYRNETYDRRETIKLTNVKGVIARYHLTRTGRVRRIEDEQTRN